MKYVYMLQSIPFPEKHYTGSTADLKKRHHDHNSGFSPHTKKYMPWKIIGYMAFSDHEKADRFESYLKSGLGRAFAKKHF